jgi:hypothetical protein
VDAGLKSVVVGLEGAPWSLLKHVEDVNVVVRFRLHRQPVTVKMRVPESNTSFINARCDMIRRDHMTSRLGLVCASGGSMRW